MKEDLTLGVSATGIFPVSRKRGPDPLPNQLVAGPVDLAAAVPAVVQLRCPAPVVHLVGLHPAEIVDGDREPGGAVAGIASHSDLAVRSDPAAAASTAVAAGTEGTRRSLERRRRNLEPELVAAGVD